MIKNRKSAWRTIAAMLVAALVFTLAPASASAAGAPPVDEAVTKLPYTDTKTIDKDTHQIKITDGGWSPEMKGYVYQVALKKGVVYSAYVASGQSVYDFDPGAVILNGNSEIAYDAIDDELDDRAGFGVGRSGYCFMALKSGIYYMLVGDRWELYGEPSAGGKYTVTLDKARYLSGTVKDSKGKPVKGAQIDMQTSKAKRVNDIYASASADKKGRYKIFGVAPGKYKMRFYKGSNFMEKPKYRLVYYKNKYAPKTANLVKMPKGKNKTGVSVRLPAYKPPKADKKVKKLPFKVKSNTHKKQRAILISGGYLLPARVYSVKLNKGSTYELALNGKAMYDPNAEITDSKGHCAAVFQPRAGDRKIAMGSFTAPKTDTYRIAAYDHEDAYVYYMSEGKFSLSLSEAFAAGKISGKVMRAGGYSYAEGIYVTVYRKYGKKWVSYAQTKTSAEGDYKVTGLKPGEYKISFNDNADIDDSGAHKYYNNKKAAGVVKMSKASKVRVYAGGTARDINVRF